MSLRTVYEFSARLLSGEVVALSRYRGQVLLIENVASLWGTTARDYTQMNGLQSEYGARGLHVLGFPCNQFGHQENTSNQEILNSLRFVRPGGGFEPNFALFEKCDVNGEKELPLFTFLKAQLPYPTDDPVSLMADPRSIIWSPVRRNDVSWNFEKFLIAADGVPYKRYGRRYETANIRDDIEKLLKDAYQDEKM